MFFSHPDSHNSYTVIKERQGRGTLERRIIRLFFDPGIKASDFLTSSSSSHSSSSSSSNLHYIPSYSSLRPPTFIILDITSSVVVASPVSSVSPVASVSAVAVAFGADGLVGLACPGGVHGDIRFLSDGDVLRARVDDSVSDVLRQSGLLRHELRHLRTDEEA